jgi:hypothetical protein
LQKNKKPLHSVVFLPLYELGCFLWMKLLHGQKEDDLSIQDQIFIDDWQMRGITDLTECS